MFEVASTDIVYLKQNSLADKNERKRSRNVEVNIQPSHLKAYELRYFSILRC